MRKYLFLKTLIMSLASLLLVTPEHVKIFSFTLNIRHNRLLRLRINIYIRKRWIIDALSGSYYPTAPAEGSSSCIRNLGPCIPLLKGVLNSNLVLP